MTTRFFQIILAALTSLVLLSGCSASTARIYRSIERYEQINTLEMVTNNVETERLKIAVKLRALQETASELNVSGEQLSSIWTLLGELEGRADRCVTGYRRDIRELRELFGPDEWHEISAVVKAQIYKGRILNREMIEALLKVDRMLKLRTVPKKEDPDYPPKKLRSYFAKVRAQVKGPVLAFSLDAYRLLVAATIMPQAHFFLQKTLITSWLTMCFSAIITIGPLIIKPISIIASAAS